MAISISSNSDEVTPLIKEKFLKGLSPNMFHEQCIMNFERVKIMEMKLL